MPNSGSSSGLFKKNLKQKDREEKRPKEPMKAAKKKKEKTAAVQWMCEVKGKVFKLGPLQCEKLAMGQTSIVLRQQELVGHGASWYMFRLTRMIRDDILEMRCDSLGTTARLTHIARRGS